MNLTAGNPIERGKDTNTLNTKKYLEKLTQEKFNGYICITNQGQYGIEEGTIILNNAQIVASEYQYYYFNKTHKAQPALERTLNALTNPKGIIDTYSLTSYQIQLVLTLNDENTIKPHQNLQETKLPPKHSNQYENQELQTQQKKTKTPKTTREQLLKKFGLINATTPGQTQKQQAQKQTQTGE